jgi:hypothetical protein
VLKSIAAISLVYDVTIGVALVFLRPQLQSLFGLPAPHPPIHADLNALFVTMVGIGYLLPYRDPIRYRAYLWIFGVALKSAGAIVFLLDYAMRGSPAVFLLFAVSDGAVAALTLVALWLTPAVPPVQRNA